MKNNYCESCKFQFRDRASFMLHIQQSHSQDKQPVRQNDLGRPIEIKIMPKDEVLSWYLKNSSACRINYGLTMEDGVIKVKDKRLFELMDKFEKADLLEALKHTIFADQDVSHISHNPSGGKF